MIKEIFFQVRLDLEEFDVAPQELTGDCTDQFLTIEGVDNTFCNINTGQHIYVGVNSVPSNKDIDFTAIRGQTFKYSIRVTQINCATNDDVMQQLRAPNGCLQYFTESGGTIRSFNYDGIRAYSPNQDYAICIARKAKHCGIRYTNPPEESNKIRSIGLAFQSGCSNGAFGVSGSQDSGCGEDCLGGSAGLPGADRDWITIAGGQLADGDLRESSSYKSYYCGRGLGVDTDSTVDGVNGNGVVDLSNGPFILNFHADSNKPKEFNGLIEDDVGFVIDYAVQAGTCS